MDDLLAKDETSGGGACCGPEVVAPETVTGCTDAGCTDSACADEGTAKPPTTETCALPEQKTVDPAMQRLRRIAVLLALGTIAYNVVEGVAAVGFGVAEESIALLGFGLDSWVEVSSGAVVLWRLRADAGLGAAMKVERERLATRIIGWLLIALAGAAIAGALVQLGRGAQPGSALPALLISGISLLGMAALWWSKRVVALKLDSRTLLADAACSQSCLELSGVLFFGSLLTLSLPTLWWLDAVVAIALGVWIAREGIGAVRNTYREDFTGGCGCA